MSCSKALRKASGVPRSGGMGEVCINFPNLVSNDGIMLPRSSSPESILGLILSVLSFQVSSCLTLLKLRRGLGNLLGYLNKARENV